MELTTSLGKSYQNIRIALAEDKRLEKKLDVKHLVEAVIKELLLFSYVREGKSIEIPLVAAWKLDVPVKTGTIDEHLDSSKWLYTLYFWSFEKFCQILMAEQKFKKPDFDKLHEVLFLQNPKDDAAFDAIEILFLEPEGSIDGIVEDPEAKEVITKILNYLKDPNNKKKEISLIIREVTLYFRLLKLLITTRCMINNHIKKCPDSANKNSSKDESSNSTTSGEMCSHPDKYIGKTFPAYSVPERFRSFHEALELSITATGYKLTSLCSCYSCQTQNITKNIINNYLLPLLSTFFTDLCVIFLDNSSPLPNVKFLILLNKDDILTKDPPIRSGWETIKLSEEDKEIGSRPMISNIIGHIQDELITLSKGLGFIPMFFLRFENTLKYVLSNKQHLFLRKNLDPITGNELGYDKSLYKKMLSIQLERIVNELNTLTITEDMSECRKAFLERIFKRKIEYVNDSLNVVEKLHGDLGSVFEQSVPEYGIGVPRHVGCSHTVLRSGYPEILHSWLIDPRTIDMADYPRDLFVCESTLPPNFIFLPLELGGVSLGICGLDKDVYIGPLREEACAIIRRKTPEIFSAIINTVCIKHIEELNPVMKNVLTDDSLSEQDAEKCILDAIAKFLNESLLIYFSKETRLPELIKVEEKGKEQFEHYYYYKPSDKSNIDWDYFDYCFEPYEKTICNHFEQLKKIAQISRNQKEIAHELSEYPHVIGRYTFDTIKIAIAYDAEYAQTITSISNWDKERLNYFKIMRMKEEGKPIEGLTDCKLKDFLDQLRKSNLLLSKFGACDVIEGNEARELDMKEYYNKEYNKFKKLWQTLIPELTTDDIIIKSPRSVIMSILENLLSNSLKHNADSDYALLQIHISTESNGEMTNVIYSDNGKGIDEEYWPLIPKWRNGFEFVGEKGYGFRSLQRSIDIINYCNNKKDYIDFDVVRCHDGFSKFKIMLTIKHEVSHGNSHI